MEIKKEKSARFFYSFVCCVSVYLGLQSLTPKWQQEHCEYLKPKLASAFPFRFSLYVVSGVLASLQMRFEISIWSWWTKGFLEKGNTAPAAASKLVESHVKMGKQLWTDWILYLIKYKLDHNFHITKSFYCIWPLKASVLLSPDFLSLMA